jgi:hypothetical protein
VELVDEAPAGLRRALGLVEGRGYAAAWLLARLRREEDGGEAATWVERRAGVVRDDGELFGEGIGRPLGELGFAVEVAEPARAERAWRRAGVEAYRRGERPDPGAVFGRLVACYDAFVDFDRSLGDQGAMCELGACLSLATWLSDAFAVVPYLWITGERGSGKTQLGTVWAETSYLGEVVLGAASYAALRDLAETGAAAYFDDAESFGGGRTGEAAKRELLLAGNRRGARVAVKAREGGRWRTHWAQAYAPRAFSAIGLPDATLGSRAIVVPLSRTLDGRRGARDPADAAGWPCDPAGLRDDLWALGLAWLARAAAAWRAVDGETAVIGRAYEPWRAVLAVAHLWEGHAPSGLAGRMRALMARYQDERAALGADDDTTEVVRGLVYWMEYTLDGLLAGGASPAQMAWAWTAAVPASNAAVVEGVRRAAPAGRLAALAPRAAAVRAGQVLGRLRFAPVRGPGPPRERGWVLTAEQVAAAARAYGVPTALAGLAANGR